MVNYWKEIDELKQELSKTKYNKRTESHIGLVKAKIAKLKEKAEGRGSKSGGSQGYVVRKSGDGTAILIGFPSSGKSTLLNSLTDANSEVGEYAFTTLTVIPGILEFNEAKIQILDVPGIVEGAASGRGRGKEVLSCIRNADLCIILVDGLRLSEYETILKEVRDAGIRINKKRPHLTISKKVSGGISIRSTVELTKITEATIKAILREFKIANCDIVIREDITDDDFIDCIEANKKYLPGIVVVNKSDLLDEKQIERIKNTIKPDLIISAKNKYNVDKLKELIFEKLDLMRVYMKEPNKEADMDIPLITFRDSTIGDVCKKLHKDMFKNFKFARIWGKSAKFEGQRVMHHHVLSDGDILEIHTK